MRLRRTVLVAGLLAVLVTTASSLPAQNSSAKEELLAAFRKGEALKKDGDWPEAAKQYEKAVALAPEVYGARHLETAVLLNRLEQVYWQLGEYGKAEPLSRRSLAIREEKLGKDHPLVAESLNNLALLYKDTGRYAEAEPLYRRSLAIREEKLGKNHPDVATSLNNLAALYEAQGQYAKAEPLYQRGLQIYEEKPGKTQPLVANTLNNLARLYEVMALYAKAEPLAQRGLEIREEKLGKDHPDVAHSLDTLAQLEQQQGRYARAEALYRRGLKIREEKLGKDSPAVATSLNNLGWLYYVQGQYDEAEPLYQRGLEIREAKLGKDHPAVASSLDNLGLLYQQTGRYPEAESLYRRSLRIREDRQGKDHPALATSLNNLANLYQQEGRYDRAEPLYRRALEVRETRLGKDHPAVASSLDSLANLYREMGQYAKAEPLYRRALEIREASLGKDHPAVAQSLNDLAVLYRRQRQYAKAEPLYQRALRIREDRLGKDHPVVAESLNNLGVVDYQLGHYAEAEPLLQRSLQIYEDRLGKDHPYVATPLNNLALLYRATDRAARAEPLYRRALRLIETKQGPDHPTAALALYNLTAVDADLGRWLDAVEATDRSRRIERTHISRVLPVLAEQEQLTFLRAVDGPKFHAALSLGLLRRQDPQTAALSAGWVLNGKAVTQQALAERALLARDSGDAAVAALGRQLGEVRSRLAALTLAAPKPGEESGRRRQLERLAQQEQELARRLGQRTGRASRDNPWVELAEVRKALPGDGVLVEIARVRLFDFKARGKEDVWRPPHYAAWIIPPAGGGDVRVIDLGPADRIEKAVVAVRQALHEAPTRIRDDGEPDAEQRLRPLLRELAGLVLEPLLEHIGGAKQWFLSPDGSLWLVPWAALPLSDGRYAVEQSQVRYLVSGRDLVQSGAEPAKGRALVLANPDYDLAPAGEGGAGTRSLVSGLPRVPPLPGTAAEAEASAPQLARYTGAQPRLYLGKEARKGVFQAAQRPRVVVLSTHGFFLEDQQVEPAAQGGLIAERSAPSPEGRSLENPLLRCGLLLAGCNQREHKVGADDGVLTGLEIVGTDLRGCELVVLSACETGLGKVRNGEGVAGLRQAFQLAGARSVVATLWEIEDRDTARLMADFFAGLAAGRGQADALREAQLALIRRHRTRGDGAAHPFFWAAFTLTGQGP
jgi:tetratricopeptide (TPR) repeat protein